MTQSPTESHLSLTIIVLKYFQFQYQHFQLKLQEYSLHVENSLPLGWP